MDESNINTQSKIKKVLKTVLLFFLLLIIFFFVYIFWIEPKILVVKEEAIVDKKLPVEFNGFKIVHFSDIHYGKTINDKELKRIVKKINELKPDVIVYTGDLFDDSINYTDQNFDSIQNILSDLQASIHKYAVCGNSDYINKDKYIEIMQHASFTVLDNSNELIYYKGNTPIQFIGTSSILEQECDITKAIQTNENDTEYFKIWLSHEPVLFDTLLENNIRPNIIFAGHTLNGLINIPFYGYLLNQEGINKYQKHYYHKKQISMYITNGLGTYKYPIRFLNPPSISLYRLYNE